MTSPMPVSSQLATVPADLSAVRAYVAESLSQATRRAPTSRAATSWTTPLELTASLVVPPPISMFRTVLPSRSEKATAPEPWAAREA